jgi:hypothetical protein
VASGYSLLAGPSSALVGAITRASEDLEEIKEDFVHLSPKYPITSFYEKGYWGQSGKCIVNSTSARMMIENEYAMGVEADHRAMCQFEDAEDAAFQVLCQRIEEAVGLDVVEAMEIGGERMAAGTTGKITERTAANKVAVAVSQESQIPMWSDDTGRGMSGIDMGQYTPKRVMMIEYEKEVPGDDVLRNIRRDRVMEVDDTPVQRQAEYAPATNPPVPHLETSRKGHGRGFLQRIKKRWG